MSLENWQKKQDKIAKFFGPNLQVEISQPREEQIDVALISDKS
jgi:hypothetical protein